MRVCVCGGGDSRTREWGGLKQRTQEKWSPRFSAPVLPQVSSGDSANVQSAGPDDSLSPWPCVCRETRAGHRTVRTQDLSIREELLAEGNTRQGPDRGAPVIKTLTIGPTCHQAAALLAVLLVTGKPPFLPPASLGLEGVTCGRDSVIRELGPSSQTTVPLLPFIICPEPHSFLDVHFEGHDRIHSGEGNGRLVSHACLQRFSLTQRPALCLFAAA